MIRHKCALRNDRGVPVKNCSATCHVSGLTETATGPVNGAEGPIQAARPARSRCDVVRESTIRDDQSARVVYGAAVRATPIDQCQTYDGQLDICVHREKPNGVRSTTNEDGVIGGINRSLTQLLSTSFEVQDERVPSVFAKPTWCVRKHPESSTDLTVRKSAWKVKWLQFVRPF